MTTPAVPPLILAVAFVPVLALSIASLFAATRWDPPRHAVDPLWTVVAVQVILVGVATAVWLLVTGDVPLAELAASAAMTGIAATVWLDRGARDAPPDPPEWPAFERAFRAYAAEHESHSTP